MIHYGPWCVTATNGDTAHHYEVYASSEWHARDQVRDLALSHFSEPWEVNFLTRRITQL